MLAAQWRCSAPVSLLASLQLEHNVTSMSCREADRHSSKSPEGQSCTHKGQIPTSDSLLPWCGKRCYFSAQERAGPIHLLAFTNRHWVLLPGQLQDEASGVGDLLPGWPTCSYSRPCGHTHLPKALQGADHRIFHILPSMSFPLLGIAHHTL